MERAKLATMKFLDSNFWIVLGLFGLLSAVAWGRGGAPLIEEAWGGGVRLFVRFGLVIFLSFLVAGLVEVLLPREWMSMLLGEEAGWRGLLLASAAGIATPAGPFVSMPVAAAMLRSGAAPAAVVSFLAAWSLLAVHRLFAWEIPILGASFALTRWAFCLVLPLAAGALTRLLFRLF
jgi:uncharacterized membrane protein YraQ (UPF0718 family)